MKVREGERETGRDNEIQIDKVRRREIEREREKIRETKKRERKRE